MKATRTMARRLIGMLLLWTVAGFAATVGAQESDRMATLRKGIQFHDQGNYQSAIAVYQALLADNPKDDVVLYELAISSMALKDFPACIDYANRSAAIGGKSEPQAIAIVASCQDDAGQLDAALKTFAKGVKKHPQNVQLNFNYGISLYRKGDLKKAAKHLEAAIQLAPAYPSPYLVYAGLRQQQGHQSIATLLYMRFLMNEPRSDRSVGAAQQAAAPFTPREGDNTITLNLNAMSGKNNEAHVYLDMMLGVARNTKVEDQTKGASPSPFAEAGTGDTDADRTVIAMQTFFLFARATDSKDAKALEKDVGWQVVQPLWKVLGENDVLATFFYHVADLAGVAGAREHLNASPENVKKLDEVLINWRNR